MMFMMRTRLSLPNAAEGVIIVMLVGIHRLFNLFLAFIMESMSSYLIISLLALLAGMGYQEPKEMSVGQEELTIHSILVD